MKRNRSRGRRRGLAVESLERRELLAARISEVMVDPLFGDNDREQYIELRGEPHQTLNDGTYLVVVSERSPSPGKIHGIFDLSGQAFGSNGYLVLLQMDHPYDIAEGANALVSEEVGFGGLPGDIYSDSHSLSERIDFIIGANTYMLIQSDVAPILEQNIDGDEDGQIDANVLADWTIHDSISLHPFVGRGPHAYGQIVFAEIGTGPGDIAVGEGVELIHTEGFGYAGRVGESFGSSSEEWIASTAQNENLHTELPPKWALADNLFGEPSQYPYAGRDLDHVGEANFVGGVRGTVTDQSGAVVENAKVFADVDGNGIHNSITHYVDADGLIDPLDPLRDEKEYPLINAFPGVTVTNFALDSFPAHAVTGEKESDFPNTLENRIFAKGGIDWFSNGGVLRFDFYRPVSAVSIVAIGNDNPLSKVYGKLEAYDAEGELIDEDLSGLLVDSDRQRISVASGQDNIAYVFAYADENHEDGGPFGRFDDMAFTQLEPSAFTDEEGYYEIRHLFPETYEVQVESGFLVSPVRTAEVTRYENYEFDFGLAPNKSPIASPANYTVSENPSGRVVVGSVIASDPDGHELSYSISGAESGLFRIDSETGWMTTESDADLNFEEKSSYSFTATVTDELGAFVNVDVNITVGDLNEVPQAFSDTFSILETAEVASEVGTVDAMDPDNNQQLTYTIVGGSGQGNFHLNSSTGEITVLRPLSVIDDVTQTLLVRVRDNGTPSLTTTTNINIIVGDVNQPPLMPSRTFNVPESQTGFSFVGAIAASDPDVGQTITYAQENAQTSLFEVDASNGNVFLKAGVDLDFESTKQYTIRVTATDNGDPARSTTTEHTINVSDINEAPELGEATLTLSEDAQQGDEVGIVPAGDPDTEADQSLSFEIVGGSGSGIFEIEETTGLVKVADSSQLDFETTESYTIDVTVTDDGVPSRSDSNRFTISIENVNEPPNLVTQEISVPEDSSGEIAQLVVSDPEPGQTHTYELIGGTADDIVSVSPSGIVTLLQPLDFETTSSYAMEIRVTDNGDPSASTTTTIPLNVADVDEAPEFVSEWTPPNAMTGEMFEFGLGEEPVDDQDGDDWVIEASIAGENLPDWLTFDEASWTFTGIPSSFFAGTFTVTLTAFDPDTPDNSTSITLSWIVDVSENPLHNSVNPHDVNNDNRISAGDALRIINALNFEELAGEIDQTIRNLQFYDVTGDNKVTARDALVVINRMAQLPPVGEQVLLDTPVDEERNDAALIDLLAESTLF